MNNTLIMNLFAMIKYISIQSLLYTNMLYDYAYIQSTNIKRATYAAINLLDLQYSVSCSAVVYRDDES